MTDRPSLLCCKTIIGKGAPTKANTGAAHGAALGEKEVAATRANIGWKYPPFEIPEDVYAGWNAKARGAELQSGWQRKFDQYAQQYPDLAREFQRRMAGTLPVSWRAHTASLLAGVNDKGETIARAKPAERHREPRAGAAELIGGSADLAASNLTLWSPRSR